ncbi:DegT/DnrJ/EryC1/StrS family aminotransferase [Candidatus Pelagibacter sp.]|nr:DegT/DnrJ/EryC1/StrS family aminotransferase [Candidatus Pelagibacter sp.]
MKNFYPRQYLRDNKLKIKHNYLSSQFANYKKILKDIEIVIKNNDFTLGKKVDEFEKKIATLLKTKYVVSLGSGTDALMLSLKALGIKENDEVITTPFTFYATIGAIVTAGARPVFVDVKDDYNIDVKKIESAITEKTKAIVPVHWAGRICDMDKIIKISKKFKIPIVEDACHAILAKNNTHLAGTFGSFGCFSLHPLKNLNVWGDGGFVLCANKKLYNKMKLLRNHGLISRDKNLLFGYNSRLDTIQAVVAINLLKKIKYITKSRIRNSYFLDTQFSNNKNIFIPKRKKQLKEVYHLYHLRFKNKKIRDKILALLRQKGVDAKIHYPTSMHLQPAAKVYGYKKGDFPVAEILSDTSISLPVHEFVTKKNLRFMSKIILENLN